MVYGVASHVELECGQYTCRLTDKSAKKGMDKNYGQ